MCKWNLNPLLLFALIFMATIPSKLFEDRFSTGVYDAIAQQIQNMGTAALAEAEYKKDFHRKVEVWSKNYIYRDNTGAEFRTNVVGQICAPTFGTIIAAKGNHYSGKAGDVYTSS